MKSLLATPPSPDFAASSHLLLEVRDLEIHLADHATGTYQPVVAGVDLTVRTGEIIGLTGQSGAGKSTLALALAGLLPDSAQVRARRWSVFHEQTLLDDYESAPGYKIAKQIRRSGKTTGTRSFYISQDARSSLVPYRTATWHLRQANPRQRKSINTDLAELAEQLHLKPWETIQNSLPAGLSTGQCQRVQLGMALLMSPQLLIADEPLASVDPKTRTALLPLFRNYVASGGTLILVTHDLPALEQLADRVLIMWQGRVVESGAPSKVFQNPTHPHTQQLLRSANCATYGTFDEGSPKGSRETLIRVEGLTKSFPLSRKERKSARAHAPNGKTPPRKKVIFQNKDLELQEGQRLGIQGKNGGGKTTFARILMGLDTADGGCVSRFPMEGEVRWRQEFDANTKPPVPLTGLWRKLQLVWQDTDLVFDPAAPVGESLREVYRAALPTCDPQTHWALAGKLLELFHLPERVLWSSPRQLSGGERRRVALARALAVFGYPHEDAISNSTLPRVMMLDEPTVGVDVFLQAEIARILLEAQAQLQLTYLVISHDQRFINRFCTACAIDWPPDLKETAS